MILTPPHYSLKPGPTIFLAGPILGAPQWHEKAIKLLDRPEWCIASPARDRSPEDTDFFAQQVTWETYWLQVSDVILFFLAEEATHKCTRSYAQTTRFELGEWLVKNPAKLVIGADTKFTGLRYIHERYPDIIIHETLEETCAAASARLLERTGKS